jgi:hypothetical protein
MGFRPLENAAVLSDAPLEMRDEFTDRKRRLDLDH